MNGPDKHVRAAVKFQLDLARQRLVTLDTEISHEGQMQMNRQTERYQLGDQIREMQKFLDDAEMLERAENAQRATLIDAPRGPRPNDW